MGGSTHEHFVGELLDGHFGSAEQAVERGRALGLALPDRFVLAALLPRTRRDAPGLADVGFVLTSRFDGCSTIMRRDPRPHLPLILRREHSLTPRVLTELAAAVPTPFVAFVSVASMGDLTPVYRNLVNELDLARASGRRAVRPVDLSTERVLRAAELSVALDFVREVLGPVLADGNGRALLATLEQALAWDGPLKTLDTIPYSTLRLHIDKIETLTGLRLTRPSDRVHLDTAVRLWRLNEELLPEVGVEWGAMAS